MNIDQAFPSKYLRAADILGQEVPVSISHVTAEQMADGQTKPVLFFQGKEKGVVLNRINAATIGGAYGPETTAWAGFPVVLFTQKVQGPNGIVDGIRIRVPTTPPAAQAQPAVQPQAQPNFTPTQSAAAPGLDDTVPF